MAKKLLIVLRVSTDKQDIESQKTVMLTFAKDLGYSEDNTILLEGIGASAVKLNRKYMAMVSKIEDYVKSKEVDCVAVHQLDRLGRNEEMLMKLKALFIDNKCQFVCKEPSIRLFNDDGSVDSGADICFSLFSTMAKQSASDMKQKMMRGKYYNRLQGKFNGGKHTFGYDVDENGFYVESPTEGPIVREMYEMYSTGKYSVRALVEELGSRGIKLTNPTALRILSDKQYCGPTLPALVSEELFEKCRVVRNEKNYGDRGERALGARIIRCHECGCAYVSSGQAGYRCSRFVKKLCPNSISLQRRTVDYFLKVCADTFFLAAVGIEGTRASKDNEKELKVLKLKLEASEKELEGIQAKKDRVNELYIEGSLSKEKKDTRLEGIVDEEKKIKRDITQYKEQIRLLTSDANPFKKLLEGKFKGFEGNERLWEKVHTFIKEVTIRRDGNNYILRAYDFYGHCLEAHYKPYPKGRWSFRSIPMY